jgi:UDP:flavonoid glycosyltransferase YjiC (YdhE family)
MATMIVTASPIRREFRPMLQIARALAARGHKIIVISGSAYRETVKLADLEFFPMNGTDDGDGAVTPGRADELITSWIRGFAGPVPRYDHRTLQESLASDPGQYLISSVLALPEAPAGSGAIRRRPLRWVGVSVAGPAISSDEPDFFAPVPAGSGKATKRGGNAQFNAATQRTRDRLNELLRELSMAETEGEILDREFSTPDATAVLSVSGFGLHRDLPTGVHLVGALPLEPVTDWQLPQWWSELDGHRPVVVVTQSTMNRDLSRLIEPTLLALAGQDLTVVAASGGADPSSLSVRVPANARVARYIPFDTLLTKADLLITDGDAGRIHRALHNGVPTIMTNVTRDESAHAAPVAHHHLSINLRTTTPSVQAIAEAATSILTNNEIRDYVTRLMKAYAEHDPIAEIERLALG